MAGTSTSVTDQNPANADLSSGVSNGEPGTGNAPIDTGNASGQPSIFLELKENKLLPELNVNSVLDQVGSITGALLPGSITNDARPLFSGSGASAGELIQLRDGETVVGTSTVAADGSWSVQAAANLSDGSHSLTVVATTSAGSTTASSAAFGLTVQAHYVGPEPVKVPTINDQPDNRTPGIYVGENLDPAPSLYINEKKVAAIYDGVTGTLTPVEPLVDGVHTITYTLSDAAGNEGQHSGPVEIWINGAPPTPVLAVVTDEMGYVARTIESNVATTDTRPVFHGTGELHTADIELWNGTVLLARSHVNWDGTWTITPDVPLTDGSYTLTLKARDIITGYSDPSEPFHLIVNTHVTEPVIQYVGAEAKPAVEAVTSVLATGETNNTRPVISGMGGGAGSTIRLMDGGVVIGTAVVSADGSWSVQPTAALSDGVHSFTAVAIDQAGKVIGGSSAVALTVDTHYDGPAPDVAPVILGGTNVFPSLLCQRASNTHQISISMG